MARVALGIEGPLAAIGGAAAVAVLFFAINLGLFAADRRAGITACFPLVALSALVSGLAWTVTVAP
jgi:hypothetical protein